MATEPTLAVIATHLRPAQGFGGPAESTAELITAWRAAGHAVVAATSDGSLGARLKTADFEQRLGAPVRTYRAMGAVRWGFGPGAPWVIASTTRGADAVYVSGIATWPTTWGAWLARALGKPYVVAVRGGLMPEHWREVQTSRPAKRLFYRWLVLPALRRAKAVHVSSALEADGVRALLPRARIVVAPNAIAPPPSDPRSMTLPSAPGLRLLFLGRLSPEKGVLGFAQAFSRVRGPKDELVVVGPAVGAYGAKVVDLCSRTPGLTYLGVAGRDEIGEHFYAGHAVVLPSGVDGDIRENFGNVVVEALLRGRPALVTAGLAWDELEGHGVGALFDRSLNDLASALQRLQDRLSAPDIARRCQAFALDRYSPTIVSQMLWRAIFDGNA